MRMATLGRSPTTSTHRGWANDAAGLQLVVPHRPGRPGPAPGRPVSRRGELQRRADRLDPEAVPVGVDVGDHVLRRPSSSVAKKSDADRRISLARRSSNFSRSSPLEPFALLGLEPRSFAGIDLGAADPLARRFRRRAQHLGHRADRLQLRSISGLALANQADRALRPSSSGRVSNTPTSRSTPRSSTAPTPPVWRGPPSCGGLDAYEPPRVMRRLQSLGGWSHEEATTAGALPG
jgi:hypothetical protein